MTKPVKTKFDGRGGIQHGPAYERYCFDNPGPEKIKELILDSTPPGAPWGEAVLTFESDDSTSEMYVLSHPQLGYFLRHGALAEAGMLSCWDRELLSTTECPDDIEISTGLFVPPPVAHRAVMEFLTTGGAAAEIEWIRPSDIPAEGNYV